MSIAIKCPACGAGYRLPESKAGRHVRCKCGEILTVGGENLPKGKPQAAPVARQSPAQKPQPQQPKAAAKPSAGTPHPAPPPAATPVTPVQPADLPTGTAVPQQGGFGPSPGLNLDAGSRSHGPTPYRRKKTNLAPLAVILVILAVGLGGGFIYVLMNPDVAKQVTGKDDKDKDDKQDASDGDDSATDPTSTDATGSGAADSGDGQPADVTDVKTPRAVVPTDDLETLPMEQGEEFPLRAMDVSLNGAIVAAAGESGTRLWRLEGRQELALIEYEANRGIEAVALSPDGNQVAVGIPQGTKVFAVTSGDELETLKGGEAVTSVVRAVAFSSSGERLATTETARQVSLWTTADYELEKTFEIEDVASNALAFSPNDELLASSDALQGEGDEETPVVKIWNVASGELQHTFEGHTGPVCDLAFSPAGDVIASAAGRFGSAPGEVIIWDVASGDEVTRLDVEKAYCLAYTIDGLFTGLRDPRTGRGLVQLWDVTDGSLVAEYPQPERHLVRAIAGGGDGKSLVVLRTLVGLPNSSVAIQPLD